MIPTQTLESYPLFGACATKIQPGDVKRENGFIEGDVYPAEWVNWKWAKDSKGIADANTGLCSIEQEINNVLTSAGITPNLSCTNQLYNAILCKIQDCVGTAAPKAHASAETTYGVGTADCYGHLKISDTYTSVLAACTGVAASQLAVACVYSVANGKAAVGNTAGCALGTAAAGTATTAARSDHVHPMPTCVSCAGYAEYTCYNCLDWYQGAAERQVMIAEVNTNTETACAAIGRSVNCKLTFNPGTGVLTSCCFCGTASKASEAVTAGGLGERASLTSNPLTTWGIVTVYNYCGDSRYYLLGVKYDNPEAQNYPVRVDYANSAGTAVAAISACCSNSTIQARRASMECWNGTSSKSGCGWCASFSSGTNCGTITVCNCSSAGIVIGTVGNVCGNCAFILAPGKTQTFTCMNCGSSFASVWYLCANFQI